MRKILSIILTLIITCQIIFSQDASTDVSNMTKEEAMELTYDQLLEMSFDDLLKLTEILEVSSIEELYTLILNNDVTAASKKAESLFEAPLSTSVVTYEEIVKAGATTFEEALRLVPGVIVRQKTNGNFDVHIRGNDGVPPGNMMLYTENSISLVMIDNRIVYNYSNGSTFWESLPIGLADIDRIEVVRGPSSALYGPNAVSGVINIVTKHPESKKPSVNVLAQGGTPGSIYTDLSASVGLTENLRIRVSGNYRKTKRFQEDVYYWVPDSIGYYGPIDELNTTLVPKIRTPYERNPTNEKFPDPSLGRESYGANAWIYYDLKDDIQFNIGGGMQQSDVLPTPLDNPYYSITRRIIKSHYLDFHAIVKGLNYQFSYTGGTTDISVTKPQFKFDDGVMNHVLEYDWIIKNLTIRPGISYMSSYSSDEKYVDTENNKGFLNGKKVLTDLGASLRLDYRLGGLRLVAAGRLDKYNYPEEIYSSYQLVASYNFNDKHLLRGVVSKANRSPFLVDTYANNDWTVIPPIYINGNPIMPNGGHFYFNGNKDMKLATMQMFEIGYRVKPSNKIQVDLEAFYTKTTDFSTFGMDSISIRVYMDGFNPGPPPEFTGEPQSFREYATFSYKNSKVESHQMGLSFDIKTVITEKLYFKVFGTIQQTKLKNHNPITTEQAGEIMVSEAIMNNRITYDSMYTPTANPEDWYLIRDYGGSYVKDSLINTNHTNTPNFYGGFEINYSPGKFNINASAYTYTKQTLTHSFETVDINPKFIVNLRVSYKVWKENEVFINARNLFNDGTKEFGFTDDIGGTYLLGIHINF
jgi:iron complex outermembrane receptor protein